MEVITGLLPFTTTLDASEDIEPAGFTAEIYKEYIDVLVSPFIVIGLEDALDETPVK
jgi:hypothetical protein